MENIRRLFNLLVLASAIISPHGASATIENIPMQTFPIVESNGDNHGFPNSRNCWVDAGNYYKVDPWLLYSIAWVESRMNPNAINVNKDKAKSVDSGLMQINSSHLPELKKFNITEENLKDSCTNIYVGAYILSWNFYRMGFTWEAIGAYNARNPYKRWVYAKKIYDAYENFTRKKLSINKS